jgi:hypothetical protein
MKIIITKKKKMIIKKLMFYLQKKNYFIIQKIEQIQLKKIINFSIQVFALINHLKNQKMKIVM